MKNFAALFLLFCRFISISQETSEGISKRSILHNLQAGDSVTIYQCHVESATQQLTTSAGQTITGAPQKYSITEKYVLYPDKVTFRVYYYTAALNVFPNRKFSGLKIREKSYWGFNFVKSFVLSEMDLKTILALENKGREAIEYDFEINKYTTNQIIFKKKKNFKQLVFDQNLVISRLINTAGK